MKYYIRFDADGTMKDRFDELCDVPVDAVEVSEELYLQTLSETDGDWKQDAGTGVISKQPFPSPTPEQVQAAKVTLVQQHMDDAARALRYDDVKTACTYADEPAVPKFQAEGQAFRAWRSLVWAACYAILADVQAGVREIPSDAELIAELPVLELPAA